MFPLSPFSFHSRSTPLKNLKAPPPPPFIYQFPLPYLIDVMPVYSERGRLILEVLCFDPFLNETCFVIAPFLDSLSKVQASP